MDDDGEIEAAQAMGRAEIARLQGELAAELTDISTE